MLFGGSGTCFHLSPVQKEQIFSTNKKIKNHKVGKESRRELKSVAREQRMPEKPSVLTLEEALLHSIAILLILPIL